MDSNERNRIYAARKSYQNGKKKGICCYSDCDHNAIKSHVFSKEATLRNISQNGNVIHFAPLCIDGKMEFKLEECNVNSASTFYGYCTEHEKIFSSIDFGNFNTVSDIILQCFRSVGFWISEESHAYKYINRSYSPEYKENLTENYVVDTGNLSDLYNILNCCILNSEKYDIPLERRNQITLSENWSILHIHLDYELPIALCTKNPYTLGNHASNIMWIVVPLKSSTELIIIYESSILDKYTKEITGMLMEEVWKKLTDHNLCILNMVEAAMMNNAMWWIKPDIFKSISNEKKDVLTTDIRYKCFFEKVWETVPYSIFDDLRKKFIPEEKDLTLKKEETAKLNYKFTFLTEQEKQKWEMEVFKRIMHI